MNLYNYALIGIISSVLVSCGGSDQVPVGSTLVAFPNQVDWQIGESDSCDVINGPFNDTQVNLSLADAEGRAIVDTNVDISLDLSEGSFNGPELLSLFFDQDGNGNFSEDERVLSADGPVFTTRTDGDNGVIRVLVRVNLSCPFRGSLFAFAGSAVTSVSFNVSGSAEGSDFQ